MLRTTLDQWRIRRQRGEDLWLFAYASLIWRPEFEAQEHHAAHVFGYHRALRMRSTVNRGTTDQPGLVFALLHGGSCKGVVYRVAARDAEVTLLRLWEREMVTSVYDPVWLNCTNAHQRKLSALGFVLPRRSPSLMQHLSDTELLAIFKTAQGRFGTTLAYLLDTAQAFDQHGIHDHEVRRMARLARQHGLVRAPQPERQ